MGDYSRGGLIREGGLLERGAYSRGGLFESGGFFSSRLNITRANFLFYLEVKLSPKYQTVTDCNTMATSLDEKLLEKMDRYKNLDEIDQCAKYKFDKLEKQRYMKDFLKIS